MIAQDRAKPLESARTSNTTKRSTRGSQDTRPLISVIIPTFNRAAMLGATLESLASQSLPKHRYEVIVVDDGSKDATAEVCRNFASRIELKYLHIENSGISAAKNTGILASRGRILLFADDDDIADRRLLKEHLKAHKQHPEEHIAVLGYTTWAPTLLVTPLMHYITEIGHFLFAYGNLKDGQILDFTYFWGGRSSCKRSFLVKHGVFNGQFRFGNEDVELGYRLSKFGFRVVFHRGAVSHMRRTLTFKEFCNRCEQQGETLFLLSRLHDDPVVQQYCQIADPFIDNRAVGVDPKARWPDVAALFQEKIDQRGRVERMLAWGFDPERISKGARSKEIRELFAQSARAEADRIQIHEEVEAHQFQMRELFAKFSELEVEVSKREAAHQRELAKLNEELHVAHQRELAKLNEELHVAHQRELAKLNEELHVAHQRELAKLNEEMKDRLMQVNRLLHSKSISLAEQEQRGTELANRLRKELWNTRKLSRLLEDAEKAAARLRSSRRWKLANPVGAIKAKLSPGRVSIGYGHLERIVAAYSEWKAAHPEIAKIEDEIRALRLPVATRQAEHGLETSSQKLETPGPPVPALPVESIYFTTPEDVEVSIIIPVFNQFPFTHACLASLQTVEEPSPFEVIVVDDCSTDETAEIVSRMRGVVYLRNETNSGFIVSCNRGAGKARGKYVVFLNNDTIVKSNWLTTLIDTFAEEPQAGIVGSKLIYPDGRLQEAGGIIWRDGSGWNYGKFDDPEEPEYNYLREVDYCSAATLIILKSLFEKIGGFDEKYAPAYYEDTDLSFKIRKAGYKVLYQPLSEIIHYEGATGGTDLASGTKKHQDTNRLIFAESWAAELMEKPVNGDVASLQKAAPGQKNILVIDHHVPTPDRDSGSVRMFQILKLLHHLGHRVTFIPANLAKEPPYIGELQKRGIEVLYHPYIKSVRDYLSAHGAKFDAVILSRCDFAHKFIGDVRRYAPQSRVIFDTVDLHFVREDRRARLTRDPEAEQDAKEKQQLEHELIHQADETWVVSRVEQQLIQKIEPEKSIQVVSNIVDIPGSSAPFALRRDWLFIGSFQHTPNVDAVLFFLEKIYPLIKDRLPQAKFYIIGDKAPPEVIRLATDNVIVTGLQPDLRPFFESVKLSIAPLRYGAGVKGKINQSMAFGVPVVATSLAVEGMELTDHEDVLLADEPEDFAHALIQLYDSEELWNRLSQNGIEKTKGLYSVAAARKRLRYLFSNRHFGRFQTSELKTLTSKLEPRNGGLRQRVS